ncbi:hypothetical protein T03_9227 [Trichinella britovi]|uniref:Uncharacterized protein n=1 Tax=Trichinella britovi TaxID=45882 RepID=A0A0V1AUP6_TRIBR|nr:hypothetical protein T03_9227 [Trichinella britovi]
MDVRKGEGGEEVDLSVGLTRECEACGKSFDVSLCANKYKWQQSLLTLKYIWNSGLNHKAIN